MERDHVIWILGLVYLFVVFASGQADAQVRRDVSGQSSDTIANAYREGFDAFRKRDFAAAATAFRKAYEVNPMDDITVYFVAGAYAYAGDETQAIEWLRKFAELKSCFAPSPTTFASLRNSEEFKRVLQKVESTRATVHKSTVAFTIPEKDLVPEGIGYDPVGKAFYIGSLHKRKIVKITPDPLGGNPKFEDFTAEGQDGLYCVLGIKIDPKRRILWAISSAEPFMKGYTKVDDGKSGLFAYDLKTGKLIKKVIPQTSGPHLLNDLILDPKGNVFLTDTRSNEIFTLRADKNEMEVLLPPRTLETPNGITISDDGRVLFIASIPMGVYRLDLETKQLARLGYVQGISLAGIDGLYFYKNSLVGVLNMINGGRVARYYLNSGLDFVTGTELIECNNPLFDDPTTGALSGNWLYYIANSQYESAFDDKGAILPIDKLHDVVILKAKL